MESEKSHSALSGNPALHFFILLFCLTLLAYLEGLQVAILALENMDGSTFKNNKKRAYELHKLVTKGNNVQKFLVGRQFFVVFVVFLIAQVTTYPTLPKFGMPDWLFIVLIQTGLPGVLIVLSFGQLMPQLIASTHPVFFMNLIGTKYIVYLTLALDWLGITHFSWLLTFITKKFICCIKTESDHIMTLNIDQKNDSNMRSSSLKSDQKMKERKEGQEKKKQEKKITVVVKDEAEDNKQELGQKSDEENQNNKSAQSDASGSSNSSDKSDNYCKRKLSMNFINNDKLSDTTSQLPNNWEDAEQWIYQYDGNKDNTDTDISVIDFGRNRSNSTVNLQGYTATPNADLFPQTIDIAKNFLQQKKALPRFLLPPKHKDHIPPHIIALTLINIMQNQDGSESNGNKDVIKEEDFEHVAELENKKAVPIKTLTKTKSE